MGGQARRQISSASAGGNLNRGRCDNANAALHYTYGRGFYEEFRTDDDFERYGLGNVVIGNETISSTDLIRRRWLDNDFYGATYSINYEKEKLNSVLGGAWNHYDGDHFGEIAWAQISAVPKNYRYYFNNGKKNDFTIYWKNNYQITKKVNAFVDLQYRGVSYKASGKENKQFDFIIDKQFNFFNPKFGFVFDVSAEQQGYASYSIGNRDPRRPGGPRRGQPDRAGRGEPALLRRPGADRPG